MGWTWGGGDVWLSVVCILCLDGVVCWMEWVGEGVEEMGRWGVDGWMIGVVVVSSLGRAGVGDLWHAGHRSWHVLESNARRL